MPGQSQPVPATGSSLSPSGRVSAAPSLPQQTARYWPASGDPAGWPQARSQPPLNAASAIQRATHPLAQLPGIRYCRPAAQCGADQSISLQLALLRRTPAEPRNQQLKLLLPAIHRQAMRTSVQQRYPAWRSGTLLISVHQWPDACIDRFAGAKDPRTHRTDRAIHRLCNFFVTQTFDLPQHDRCPKFVRQAVHRP